MQKVKHVAIKNMNADAWKKARIAAFNAEITVAEWLAQAIREKIERDKEK